MCITNINLIAILKRNWFKDAYTAVQSVGRAGVKATLTLTCETIPEQDFRNGGVGRVTRIWGRTPTGICC